MKATRQSIGRAVEQPDPRTRFYLFCGQDEGQSRALASRLLEALGAAKCAVAAAPLKENPAALADEAAALSLFGERRLIWIEPAFNDIAPAVELLLSAEATENPVVAIAGALTKASALLKMAESSPSAIAFTAYVPDSDQAADLVVELGRRVGLKVGLPVAARIAAACGNDQAIVAQELEKFALYVGASPNSPKELDHEAVDAVGASSSDGDFLRLADLALLGESNALSAAMSNLSANGAEAIPAIRSLQRRLLMLAPARARIERGERLEGVMTSFGKALFWKDKDRVARMLRNWTADELARVAERAGALERNLIFSDVPAKEALGEELMALARKARSRAA